MGRVGCDMLFHCTVKVVVLLLVGGIYASRNLEMFSVIRVAGADNGSVRHGVLCFFRKYMCGVDVLEKGCGGIHVQVYVSCHVFEVVKSYLCVSVPVLDDDCGAFVRFVYDDSIMDDMLLQGLCFIVCYGFGGICNGMCTSSIIEVFTMFIISMSMCYV